ncbi:transposon protein [Seminavis robusta]|uniref:Transposon protein n=1 Tax=Seminavis robusta TaxID=568900 RepID=A0A9N8HJH0_9STRA|nr:transposon protein [Seminavis robusta]|eukprot:Sro552_g165080.1 transposon protein (1058) ;mRNA; r:27384-31061
MPPPASGRWAYFTKGIHPNPPVADGRTAGTPHTSVHPCSNPKLFWVQCNFCIERNGGKILQEDRAWMKSREEQMMHHLKTCCPESMRVWEDIIDWKTSRRTNSAKTGMKTNNSATIGSSRKRQLISASSTGINSATGKPTKTAQNKKVKRGGAASVDFEGVESGSFGAENMSFLSPSKKPGVSLPSSSRAVGADPTKLNPTQLRYFHKVCSLAIASQKLPYSFFEEPVMMELFHILRPGLVTNGQLPTRSQFTGDGTNKGYIEKYAMEQVSLDLGQIVRSLKRYEGLKAALACQPVVAKASLVPPSTLTCGGELSCRVVPAMHAIQRKQSTATHKEDPAVALAAIFERMLKATSVVLGRAILGDEEKTMEVTGQVNKSNQPIKHEATEAIDPTQGSRSESNNDEQQSVGFSSIGSCLLQTATNEHEKQSTAYPPGTLGRAQRILALRWPMISFLSHGCLEEQLNLLMKDLLTKLPGDDLLEPLEQAFSALRAIEQLSEPTSPGQTLFEGLSKAVNDSYLGGSGTNDQVRELLPVKGCVLWSSWICAQRAFAMLLRIKVACKMFVGQNSLGPGFPSDLIVLADIGFWEKLERAECLIRPIIKASLKFVPEKGSNSIVDEQTIAPTMADVVHLFYSLAHLWKLSGGSSAAKLVERRWKQYEQPWFLLAFVLHPAYTEEAKAFLKKQTKEDGLFSAKYLANAVLGYTVKYLAAELTADPPLSMSVLKRQTSEYLDKVERGEVTTNETSMQMQKDWKEYWTCQTTSPELSKFALFILSVTVQANTAESFFHSLAATSVKISLEGDRGMQKESLKEHLTVLEKAPKQLTPKWQQQTGEECSKRRQMVNPTEKSPSQGKGSEPGDVATAASLAAKKPDSYEPYDPLVARNEFVEDQVAASLDSCVSRISNQTVTKFWIRVLNSLDDSEIGDLQDDDEYARAATASPADDNAVASEDEDDDSDMPQFTLPTYAKGSAPGPKKKVRRTYRPEQVKMDFMANWKDLRDEAIDSSSDPPGEEVVSQLKNYRANKITLLELFPADQVPPSVADFFNLFDDGDNKKEGA